MYRYTGRRDLYDPEKERREAIMAGEKALQSLHRARKSLNVAGGWGLADLVGGGFLTGMLKHSNLEDAQRHIEQAKKDVRDFDRELSDIHDRTLSDLSVDVGGLMTMADLFFDGVLTDLLVQDRIQKAKKQVDYAIDQIQRALDRLGVY